MFLFKQTAVVFRENPTFSRHENPKPTRENRQGLTGQQLATGPQGPMVRFWGWLGLAHSHNHDIGNMPHFLIGHIHLYRNGGFFPWSCHIYVFFYFFSGLWKVYRESWRRVDVFFGPYLEDHPT